MILPGIPASSLNGSSTKAPDTLSPEASTSVDERYPTSPYTQDCPLVASPRLITTTDQVGGIIPGSDHLLDVLGS